VHRKLALTLALAAGLLAAPSAFAYGWPLKPFHTAHPIRGNFGDPRTVFWSPFELDGLFGAGAFSFHNGLDISAPPGQAVYPVKSGIAHVPDLAAVTVRSRGGRVFKYMHITPTVYEGQRVKAYKTVLGHVDAAAAHVHFSEIDNSIVVNPLGTHHLRPYSDWTKPRVNSVLFAPPGSRGVKTRGVSGSVEITAEAFDTPALPVPGPWSGYPVAPALVRWALVSSTGRYVVQPRTVVDFRYTLPLNREFWRVYARGTYQNKPRFASQQFRTLRGKFEFRLTQAPLDTRRLADGNYLLKVTTEDTAGNRSTRTETITVCNADPASCTTPPSP
jgi:murein DD-endopeptidase MepM/ murein hydrolase activator NlpD